MPPHSRWARAITRGISAHQFEENKSDTFLLIKDEQAEVVGCVVFNKLSQQEVKKTKKKPPKKKQTSKHSSDFCQEHAYGTGERERPRNRDCIGKELQGLFVMTKLDAKTVIKGDGEEMEI